MCRLSAMWVKGNEISLCCRENTVALRHTIKNFGLFWLGPEYCIVTEPCLKGRGTQHVKKKFWYDEIGAGLN